MTSHRLRLVGVCVALSVVVSGCSRPQDKVLETATIRTAPPATEPPPTIATTLPEEITTTTPVATSSVAPTTVMNDSEAIRTAAETYLLVLMEQEVSSLDPLPLRPLTTAEFYQFQVQTFDEERSSGKYNRRGKVKAIVVKDLHKISKTKSTVVACDKNDTQIWDSKGTPELSDDLLINGDLGVIGYLVTLSKEGDSWLIADLNDADSGSC
jgi:hypothetical protein